jgi:hypothetical protein
MKHDHLVQCTVIVVLKTPSYVLYVLPAAAGLVVVALGCFCCQRNVANKPQRSDSSLLHNVAQSEGSAHGVNQREQTTSSLWRNIMSMNDGPMENSSSNELTSPSYSYEPPSAAPGNGDGGVASGAALSPQPPALTTIDPTRVKSQSELYVGGGD